MDILCRRVQDPTELGACLAIRHEVFVIGQHVPLELEQDGLEDECFQYIAFDGHKPVATARIRPLVNRYKVQRMAVLENQRGTGVGAKLLQFMLDDLAGLSGRVGDIVFLQAQLHAVPFYERFGFEVTSGPIWDAGIEHRDMERAIIGR